MYYVNSYLQLGTTDMRGSDYLQIRCKALFQEFLPGLLNLPSLVLTLSILLKGRALTIVFPVLAINIDRVLSPLIIASPLPHPLYTSLLGSPDSLLSNPRPVDTAPSQVMAVQGGKLMSSFATIVIDWSSLPLSGISTPPTVSVGGIKLRCDYYRV